METRFVAFDRLGSRRGVLPHVLEANYVPTKNELPTLTLTYPRRTRQSKYLENDPEVAFQFRHEGKWVEPLDARFRLQSTDFDLLEETETKVYTFIGIGEAVRGIYIFDSLGLPVTEDGAVQFGRVSAGEILTKVWDGATARGWKGFTRSFSPTHDSNGLRWNELINISLEVDTSFESVLLYLVRGGLVDFHWEGRTLHAYSNGSYSRDNTGTASPLRFNLSGGPTSVDAAPELTDRETMATHVIVNGESGLRWEFPTGAILPEGRREVFLSYSGVDEEVTARILAAPTIVKYSNTLKNTTRQFRVTSSTKIKPLIDYRIGDYAMVEKSDGEWERMQIYTVALIINAGGVQGYVGLGDKIDTLLEILNEKVQRISGGAATESPGELAPSNRQPSPVKSLSVSTETYIDSWGLPKSSVSVSFVHDGNDIHGSPVTMERYSVQFRAGTTGPWSEMFTLEAPTQQGTFSPLETFDSNGDLMRYQFRVYAHARNGTTSAVSAIAEMTTRRDTTKPDEPAPPKITSFSGMFTISTDHLTDKGLTQQSDYSHVIVQMATAPNGATWQSVGVILKSMPSFTLAHQGYGTRWFRLIAVDTSGNLSVASDVVSGTTRPLVDTDIILSELDGAILTDESIVTKHLKVTSDMMVKLLSAYKIKAGDIETNTLTADSGFVGSMRTNILTANSITGAMVSADAISAKHTITGALIRTNATGARTEITREGIRQVDAAGNELLKIGYGLTTGLAVRNPGTNALIALDTMVFGIVRETVTVDRGYGTTDERAPKVYYEFLTGQDLLLYHNNVWYPKEPGEQYSTRRKPLVVRSHTRRGLITMQLLIAANYNEDGKIPDERKRQHGTTFSATIWCRSTDGQDEWKSIFGQMSWAHYAGYATHHMIQEEVLVEPGKDYNFYIDLEMNDLWNPGAYITLEQAEFMYQPL